MKSNEKNIEIAKYWIIKAKDSLKSAQLEYEQRLLSFAANRLYYAAFYAASSVLARRGQITRVKELIERFEKILKEEADLP